MTDKIANPERGEVAITLDGRRFVMRPDFEHLVEMEVRTGVGLVELTRRIASGKYGVRDMAAIVTAGLKGAGEERADFAKVGAMILADGLTSLVDPVNQFLINAITGGKTPSGDDSSGEADAASGQS
ncbi:hypothetical protein FRZ44_38000 [Hypericibacter terrae]|uniref:Gene transfer agent family protein n=1 Tax=Hypericibacter terrae TaxID=2602015 RepID=A0A5J6MM96_9PROT|nr:gene transfer agent family protein [Hypericibacter terrae]QEX18493.1 hypothetical protein FRZ44_38000 [Hypericibacter terrae]